MPARGFRTIYAGTGAAIGFNSSGAAVPFTFNSRHGDSVVLSQTDTAGNLTGYQVYESFESVPLGTSFGHYDTSVPDDYKFVAMNRTTFGADDASTVAAFRTGSGLTNASPQFGPIVISEILYAPTNTIYYAIWNGNLIPVYGPNPAEQFIELQNTSNQDVALFDPANPANRWRLQNAVDYVFPQTNLPANSFCLVVSFNPWTNTAALNTFRNRHRVPTDVLLFGPWTGTFEEDGDAVELYRPDSPVLPPDPEAGYVPYVRVDKVKYGAAYPDGLQHWIRTTGGDSLQRRDSLAFGNDPINWAAALPTPGAPSPPSIVDSDRDGMSDAWEIQYGLNPTDASDAVLDFDNDTSTNLGEFMAGSNPTNALSVLRLAGIYPSSVNSAVALHFVAYSNTSYRVEYRNTFNSEWKKLQNVPALSSNRAVYVYDYGPANDSHLQRYYRIAAPVTN